MFTHDILTLPTPHLAAGLGITSIITLLLGFLGSLLVRKTTTPKRPCDLPVLNLRGDNLEQAKLEFLINLPKYLTEGREQHRNGFQLWSPEGYVVFLPEECVDELKGVNDSVATSAALKNAFGQPEWVRLDFPVITKVVLHRLSPKISFILKAIVDEVDYAIDTEIGPCEDWTAIPIYPRLLRIVALLAGRAFVGQTLNRTDEWLDAQLAYTMDLFTAAMKVRNHSNISKFFALKLHQIPEVNQVHAWQAVARKYIVPIIKQRTQEQAADPSCEKPNDMIQWVMEAAPKDNPPLSMDDQADLQMLIGLASIHTTSVATTNILYDLIYRAGYFEPLREEADRIWKEDNAALTKTSMSKMVKLDSFMKESQRYNANNLITFNREIQAKAGVTLSTGLHLPHGTQVAVAPQQISLDPAVWESASEFRGFRFADLRSASKEDSNKFQYVTTNSKSMHFGHGVHACPGRFLASNEIKTIMTYMIRRYDIKAPEGKAERPTATTFGMEVSPDPSGVLMFRKRAAASAS